MCLNHPELVHKHPAHLVSPAMMLNNPELVHKHHAHLVSHDVDREGSVHSGGSGTSNQEIQCVQGGCALVRGGSSTSNLIEPTRTTTSQR